MIKLSPTFLEGILLVLGSIRFLGEPLGVALLILGGIVIVLEFSSLPKLLRS